MRSPLGDTRRTKQCCRPANSRRAQVLATSFNIININNSPKTRKLSPLCMRPSSRTLDSLLSRAAEILLSRAALLSPNATNSARVLAFARTGESMTRLLIFTFNYEQQNWPELIFQLAIANLGILQSPPEKCCLPSNNCLNISPPIPQNVPGSQMSHGISSELCITLI